MHCHSPIGHKKPFIRFVRFLFSPTKTFCYYRDGEDICDSCNSHICLPEVYYHPFIKGLYFCAGGLFGVIASKLPFNITLISFMLIGMFHHVVSSAIFAFGQWTALDSQKQSVEYFHAIAKKDSIVKAICISIGFVLPFCLF